MDSGSTVNGRLRKTSWLQDEVTRRPNRAGAGRRSLNWDKKDPSLLRRRWIQDPSSRCSSGQESFVGFMVNHNRPPLPAFFISVDFKETLSCFRITTSRSVDSKGGYGRYYQTLCTGVDSKWLGTWAGTGCCGD